MWLLTTAKRGIGHLRVKGPEASLKVFGQLHFTDPSGESADVAGRLGSPRGDDEVVGTSPRASAGTTPALRVPFTRRAPPGPWRSGAVSR